MTARPPPIKGPKFSGVVPARFLLKRKSLIVLFAILLAVTILIVLALYRIIFWASEMPLRSVSTPGGLSGALTPALAANDLPSIHSRMGRDNGEIESCVALLQLSPHILDFFEAHALGASVSADAPRFGTAQRNDQCAPFRQFAFRVLESEASGAFPGFQTSRD